MQRQGEASRLPVCCGSGIGYAAALADGAIMEPMVEIKYGSITGSNVIPNMSVATHLVT